LVVYEVLVGESVFSETWSLDESKEKQEKGFRPRVPEWIDPVVKGIIEDCWAMEPDDRPTADEVYGRLRDAGFPLYGDVSAEIVEEFISEIED
jgi:hypothetical protein